MKNFLRLDGLSILSVQYMYIDYKDYLADSLLAQNHVSVRLKNEFHGTIPHTDRSRKSQEEDTAGFEKIHGIAMHKMLLFGHNDYMGILQHHGNTEQNRGAA